LTISFEKSKARQYNGIFTAFFPLFSSAHPLKTLNAPDLTDMQKRIVRFGNAVFLALIVFLPARVLAGTQATAAFVRFDVRTQGNWRSSYGVDGYDVAGDLVNNPSYVTPVISQPNARVWHPSAPGQTHMLQRAGNAGDRIAAAWVGEKSLSVDLNLTDAESHNVALYFVDYDAAQHRQTVDVLDADGNLLNSQQVAAFASGLYMVWKVSGHVSFRISGVDSSPAVLNGIFFNSAASVASAVPPIPQQAQWEVNMWTHGAQHCDPAAIASAIGAWGVATEQNVWYYDGTNLYYSIADYLGPTAWWWCASFTDVAYRDWVLATTAGASWPVGALNGWRIFPRGLLKSYQRVGDTWGGDAVRRLANNSAFAGSGGGASVDLCRETAYMINAFMADEELGDPRNPLLATSVNYALGHLNQWFGARTAGYEMFLVGLTMQALINYYGKTQDPRVPPAIHMAIDGLWNEIWLPAYSAFAYDSSGANVPDPGENLLVAPAFAWYWQLSGDPVYQDRGDQAFAGGVLGAWLDGGKQFSQNYYWSFDYVKWRSSPPGTLVH
jgi:hypothetical protein